MTDKELRLIMGEIMLDAQNGEAIHQRALKYREAYNSASEDDDIDMAARIYLSGAYAAFMEGYADEQLCIDIAYFLRQGYLLPARSETDCTYILAAVLQYGVEHFESAWCAETMLLMYQDGTIEGDKDIEWQWLNRAAELGSRGAQTNLGYELCQMNRHYDAEDWFLAAAEQGDVQAMYNLGVLYQGSHFYDYPKAGYWFDQAARSGSEDAARQLRNYVYNQKHQKWLKKM